VISFVSSTGLQPYPAKGPVLFAVGTDFGIFSTFSRSVFKIFEGIEALLSTGVDVDSVEEAGGV
jgi:hypothetical protein